MTTFACRTCGAKWSMGPTRDYREDQQCHKCAAEWIAKLEQHASVLAEALDGYQESCGEDHARPKFDCPTCGREETVLVAYREFVQQP